MSDAVNSPFTWPGVPLTVRVDVASSWVANADVDSVSVGTAAAFAVGALANDVFNLFIFPLFVLNR